MVIDLPASSQNNLRGSQNPVTQLSAQRQEAVQAALKALNIKAGETVAATIKAATPVDNPLRARLIQLANPVTDTADTALLRNSTHPNTPDAGGNNALTPAQKLLNAATLKLLELEIRGKTLLVFSDRPAKNGQTLNLQLQQGSLVVVAQKPTPGSYTTNIQNPQTSSPNPAPTSAAQTLSQAQRTTMTNELRGLIANFEARHQASPLAQTLSSVLQLSNLLPDTFQHRPTINTQMEARINPTAALPKSVQESLQQLAGQLRSPQQLAQPSQLKQSLLNSGIQLEHKLSSTSTPDKLAQQELKAGLLQTLSALSKNSTSAQQNSTSEQRLNGLQNAPSTQLPPLSQLLQQLMASPASGATSIKPEQIAPLLQQQIAIAINKLLYSQLKSISRSQPSFEGQPTQHIQLELPVRYGHEVHSIAIQLEEDWVQEFTEEERKATEKVRQWLVKLSFELPDAGSLHAHIKVIEDSVSTSLWAEKHQTFEEMQTSLDTLRQRLQKDGCEVKKIECFEGRPSEENTQLGYALVDIKT